MQSQSLTNKLYCWDSRPRSHTIYIGQTQRTQNQGLVEFFAIIKQGLLEEKEINKIKKAIEKYCSCHCDECNACMCKCKCMSINKYSTGSNIESDKIYIHDKNGKSYYGKAFDFLIAFKAVSMLDDKKDRNAKDYQSYQSYHKHVHELLSFYHCKEENCVEM